MRRYGFTASTTELKTQANGRRVENASLAVLEIVAEKRKAKKLSVQAVGILIHVYTWANGKGYASEDVENSLRASFVRGLKMVAMDIRRLVDLRGTLARPG